MIINYQVENGKKLMSWKSCWFTASSFKVLNISQDYMRGEFFFLITMIMELAMFETELISKMYRTRDQQVKFGQGLKRRIIKS